MEPKRDKILSASIRLFAKLGFKKVTMGDIAEAAEMSRPTLYAAFSSKEAIFAALGERHADRADAELETRLPKTKTLEAKLALAFEVWVSEPFASIIDEPKGLDLLGNAMLYAPEAGLKHYARFERHLEAILGPAMAKSAGMTARDLAHILMLATRGLKASSTSLAEVRRMSDGLIAMAVATAGASSSKRV